MDGLIIQGEKYNKVVDVWLKCNDKVIEVMMLIILVDKYDEVGVVLELNLVYMMVYFGVCGLVIQMKQLGGMCGLMVKFLGEIIEMLIILNFKEGLIVFEYFNLIYGVCKGLLDMVLKIVNLGYLICCLVDVV